MSSSRFRSCSIEFDVYCRSCRLLVTFSVGSIILLVVIVDGFLPIDAHLLLHMTPRLTGFKGKSSPSAGLGIAQTLLAV